MSKKHFRQLAQAIKQAKLRIGDPTEAPLEVVEYLQSEIADVCKANNRNFSYQTFNEACEVR